MSRIDTRQARGSGYPAAPAIAPWALRLLALAATPVFALMAMLSAVQDDGGVLCSMQHASPLTGMAAMYMLMSAFHLSPWIKLIAKWGRGSAAYRAEPPISTC